VGQYKVPQDVEAEDKLIGPLSLRQFIYVVIGVVWAGLMFFILRPTGNSDTAIVNYVIMAVVIIPITGFFLLLGFGKRQEQSFEKYFVALVRFYFVPRVRIWDKDLSTVELIKEEVKAPEIITQKNVSRSSLQQLALVMDTHGSIKDPTIQLQDEENQASAYGQRVINPTQIAGNVADRARTLQVTQQDDVLDASNPRSAQVNELLQNEEATIHQQAIQQIKQNMATAQAPQQNQPAPISQPQTSSAILKKAMLQSNNLTVQQLANQANSQELKEGQQIKLSPGK
jgi:hypothetical protein